MRVRKKKDSVTADFEQFLKNNNCQYDIEHEDNATIYNFEFQAARFVAAIRKQKSKAYVTKRWHVLAIINKNLPYSIYKKT